jgi:hypothetical protein
MNCLAKFFGAFDSHLLCKMGDEWPPEETEITRKLWSMMGGKEDWRISGIEDDPITWLKAEIAREGFDISFEMKLRGHAGLEADITSSDFGLVIIYEDVVAKTERKAPYIVQAKKLHRSDRSRIPYSANDKFTAANDQQRLGLSGLGKILGEHSVKYMAYCPRLGIYDQDSQRAIRSLHAPNIGTLYAGTQFGLALSANLLKPDGPYTSGNWVTPIAPRLHTAASLHERAFRSNLPFGWFVIANLCALISEVFSEEAWPWWFPSWGPLTSPLGLNINDKNGRLDLTYRLALCDEAAIAEVAREMGKVAPDCFFPPAASLAVRVQRAPQLELDLVPPDEPDAPGVRGPRPF